MHCLLKGQFGTLLIVGLGLVTNSFATVVPVTVLSTATETCIANTGQFPSLACSTFGSTPQDSALAATPNGLTGLKFWLSSPLLDNELSGNRTTVITFTATGSATGTGEPAGIAIPFTYDFSLSASAGTLTNYSLVFNILQGSTSIFSSAPTFTGTLSGRSGTLTGGNQFTTINPITPGQSYTVSAALTVNWNTGAGAAGLTVTIPQNSFDVNSPTFVQAGVPEPASFGMLGIGLLAGAAVLRRRK
jgi:hypothetical protein